MNWKELFKIGSYTVWKAQDMEGKAVYSMTKLEPNYHITAPKPTQDDGGYYCLSWLLRIKGF